MKIKDLPLIERPREKLLMNGVDSLSDTELLSIILKTGTKDYSVKDIACEVLKKINNLSQLQDFNIYTLDNIKGLGKVKKMEIMAAIELGKRVFLQKNDLNNLIYNSAEKIYLDNRYLFFNKKQEYFYCLYLDNKKRLIERKLLFMGTINRSIVHPREIFKEAYLTSASGIVCMHNHPSGDINPSIEDVHLTQSLIEIGKLQGINVIDHLIIGKDNYYSFYDKNKDLFI